MVQLNNNPEGPTSNLDQAADTLKWLSKLQATDGIVF
jgi:hypothetical protein